MPNNDVQFEEDRSGLSYTPRQSHSWVTKLVIKWSGGAIKDKKQAQGVMLVISGVALLLAIIILVRFVF